MQYEHCKKVTNENIKNDYKRIEDLTVNAEIIEHDDIIVIKSCKSLKRIVLQNSFKNAYYMEQIIGSLLEQCKGIVEIDLRDNKLKSLPSQLFHRYSGQLEVIRIDSNEITELNKDIFKKCEHLERAYIENNKIHYLPETFFDQCSMLTQVNFKSNEIVELSPDTFKGCKQLKKIYFNNNKIRDIPIKLFDDCTNLLVICFDSNEISHLPSYVFKACGQLEIVSFVNNEIKVISLQSYL